MRSILEAFLTFLVAVAVGVIVNLVALGGGTDNLAAGSIGTAVALVTGLMICQRRKPTEQK